MGLLTGLATIATVLTVVLVVATVVVVGLTLAVVVPAVREHRAVSVPPAPRRQLRPHPA